MKNVPIKKRGYTLVELIVSVGLFALIMTLASGAYLMMIGMNRQAQGVMTGINSLSFALEAMTRSIRTGSTYNCSGVGDCPAGGNNFSFKNDSGVIVEYRLSASALQQTVGGVPSTLTDSRAVSITSLTFYATGTKRSAQGDYQQPHVTIVVSGKVQAGAGKPPQNFTIQTGATMRGTDL